MPAQITTIPSISIPSTAFSSTTPETLASITGINVNSPQSAIVLFWSIVVNITSTGADFEINAVPANFSTQATPIDNYTTNVTSAEQVVISGSMSYSVKDIVDGEIILKVQGLTSTVAGTVVGGTVSGIVA